jgi:hypothetical protein
MIISSYKQNRHEDDLNQPLSVQPWGSDADRRRYFLVEGLDDTHFRVYRESNYTGLKRTWWSVASDIDELKLLAEKLEKEDGGQKARVLSAKMLAAVPRFEATEEVCSCRPGALIPSLTPKSRNESVVNIGKPASNSLNALSRISHYMKAVHVGRG